MAASPNMAVAAGVLVIGLVFAFVVSIRQWNRTKSGVAAYKLMRQTFGGVEVKGLDVGEQ